MSKPAAAIIGSRSQHRGHPAEPPCRRDGELPGPGAEVDDGRRAVETAGFERGDVRFRVRVPLLAVEARDEPFVEVLGTRVRQLVEHPHLIHPAIVRHRAPPEQAIN
jgi:hypothetical protein